AFKSCARGGERRKRRLVVLTQSLPGFALLGGLAAKPRDVGFERSELAVALGQKGGVRLGVGMAASELALEGLRVSVALAAGGLDLVEGLPAASGERFAELGQRAFTIGTLRLALGAEPVELRNKLLSCLFPAVALGLVVGLGAEAGPVVASP